MDNGYSLSDVAAVSGRDSGMFGGSGMWIFALLVLCLLGNGGGLFGGNRNDRNATVGDVQRATDFAALERQNNEGVAATRQGVYDIAGAVKDGNYNILGELRDLETTANSGFAAMQKCCCDTQRAIDSVNYNGAINTASINANTTAQTQKILDAMAQNKIDALQAKVSELQTAQMFCGIPRISPYGYGVVPQFAPMCGGNI